MALNYSLYLVTDRSFLKGRSLKYCIEEAIKGGVTIVQIREKDASTKEFYNMAKEIKETTDKYNVPLIINDRIDIAMAVDAEGVHLGQSDMPLNIARKILGDNKIIGISANNLKEAKEAQENGADYIGVGPVFYTSTKKDINVPTGIEGLREVAQNIKIPMVAIGGINEDNVSEVMKSGIDGISLISAILNKKDIQKASKLLKDKIEKGR